MSESEQRSFTDEEKALITQGMSRAEAIKFLHVAEVLGLDPFLNEIHPGKFQGQIVPVVSIHGAIRKAVETGDYAGMSPPRLLVKTQAGEVTQIEQELYVPGVHTVISATVEVHTYSRPDNPDVSTALMAVYNTGQNYWKKDPVHMLVKTATMQGLRKAGLIRQVYSSEELAAGGIDMDMDDAPPPPPKQKEKPQPPNKPVLPKTPRSKVGKEIERTQKFLAAVLDFTDLEDPDALVTDLILDFCEKSTGEDFSNTPIDEFPDELAPEINGFRGTLKELLIEKGAKERKPE